MTFQDIFKSSFLENIATISILDMVIAMVLAFLLGLFIFFDEPPIPFDPKAVMERFCEIQKGCKEQYDFLFLAYRNRVIYFDFPNTSYKAYPIKQNAFDNLSICARKLVEKSKNG